MSRMISDDEVDQLRDSLNALRGVPDPVGLPLARRLFVKWQYHSHQWDLASRVNQRIVLIATMRGLQMALSETGYGIVNGQLVESEHLDDPVDLIVWTAEPPERDLWWLRVGTEIPIALHLDGIDFTGPGFAYTLNTLRDYGEQGDRFAAIPGGIPRGPVCPTT